MKSFKKYIKKYLGWFLVAVLILIGEAICDLIQPTIMAKIIDVGVSNKDINYILKTGGLMIGITAIGAVFAVTRSIVSTNVSQKFAYDLRNDMFIKINQYSLKDIDKFSRASLITRNTNDINQLQQFVHGMMRVFIKAPILCVGSFIIAMKLNFKMSLIILVAIIIIFTSIVLNMKIGFSFFKSVQKSTDKVNLQIRQFLSGIKIVKLFDRSDYEINKFEQCNEELYINSTKAMIRVALFRPIIEIIINIAIVIILIIGGYSVVNGGIKIGVIVAYINYMSRILTSLIMISHILNVFVRAKASYERVVEVLDNDNIEIDNKVNFESGDIEFVDVDFSYNENEKVLKNISFKINQGQNIGIIGETGSGKTALINLICKLYNYESGKISINNIDIKNIDDKDLRKNIGLVFQKTSVFGKSIIENITMGDDEISLDMVMKACKITQADEFIEKFEHSYEEVISQGGKNLSGGQKQRITIARAIAKNPKILILDDCYSAMDISTETNVRENIKDYIKNNKIITITVSQKVSSIIDCDKIIVLDGGNIVGFDKHDNLLKNSQVYKEIYNLQTIGREMIN